MRTLTAYVEWDPETKLYVGIVPGIAGAHTQGATLDELQKACAFAWTAKSEDSLSEAAPIECRKYARFDEVAYGDINCLPSFPWKRSQPKVHNQERREVVKKMDRSNGKGTRTCQICGEERIAQLRPAVIVRAAMAELIKHDKGQWVENGWVCVDDLHKYSHKYVKDLLKTERDELTELDQEVIKSLRKEEILARDPEEESPADLTLGQRLADQITNLGGSWTFLSIFVVVILGWLIINSVILIARPFDPYPYIFLNLVLSALAAIQAPVILMSQNRQEARDRMRAVRDYQVNLKAELEIRQLHQKIDHMLSRQWERLVEIQEIQMELINEMRERK